MKQIVLALEEGIDLLQHKLMVMKPLTVVKYYLVIVHFVIEKIRDC